jgi:predicted enzyme related to lactoylglutathione lyase
MRVFYRSASSRTGYRRYSRDQLTTVKLITDLRWLAVPIQQVREIIANPESTRASKQNAQYADEGVTMPTITSGTTPVQIKIGVSDVKRAREFYVNAFGIAESVIRHTDEFDVSGFQFGTYGQPGFFLMFLLDSKAFDQPGRSTFGFLVADLDETHRRALDAGAVEAVAINTPEGMPRNSAVTDPDGNWIWLYQG